ncbi:futalosine hydrolase [Streptomyces sp. TRM70308]|uniref:futalosine hydrolase n=1 Tax=Streptomyces sp. TRM70308 TaxID=3131932 RepID=UPI003CFCA0F2
MQALVVTAVPPERDAVTRAAAAPPEVVELPGGGVLHRVSLGGCALDALAAGVGPAAAAAGTAVALTAAELAGAPYGAVVCAGIGGGFGVPPGRPVVASAIVAADLGAETAEGFLPVTELGFGVCEHRPPPARARALADAVGAALGAVLTVSTVTGTAAGAAELVRRHPDAVAEAMEGFGVAQAAAGYGTPVFELRTVSNAVGPRDRAAWRVPEALTALTGAFRAATPVLEGWT